MKQKISMKILLLITIFLIGSGNIIRGQNVSAWKYSSGDDEIDHIREEIRTDPTDISNYEYRGLMLRLWQNSLQQQGALMAGRFKPVNIRLNQNRKMQEEEITRYSKIIDQGYLILDSIQNEITADPSKGLTPLAPDPKRVIPPVKIEKPWPQYMGPTSNIGFNETDGPVYGRIAWEFPVGLAWESRPVIEKEKVYLVSPGIRNILFTLDINSGEVINTAKQLPGFTYYTPAYSSSPIVLKDYVLAREIGSYGNNGTAKEVAYINKNTWQVEKETFSGAVDYRVGYAPLAGNEKYMVFPYSVHDIHLSPPITQTFNRIICKDTRTGNQIWDINTGHTLSEPLLDDDKIFVGTMSGYIYCLNANPVRKTREGIIAWQFKAGDAINRRVTVDEKQVYFGANDGSVYCLNKETGDLVWKFNVDKPVPESFRHFSTPFVRGNHVFIGSADKQLYCLDAFSGKLIFKYQSSDWVRASPVATSTNIYFASMNGDLYNIDYSGNKPKEVWKKRIGDHWIYADLALSDDKLILNDSDLYSYCINTVNGEVLWRFSILKSFHQEDGYRILTDQLAGGGYYQSKATAADGKVFIGTPSRFVYAMNAETGKEIWKFEMGAAISGAPVYDNNKIYIGQQGGEDDFYCLDAETGKLIWKQNVGWVWGSAAVSDGMAFIPAVDGYMYGVDANNGDIIWRFRADKSVCSEPLVMGEYVYFGSWDQFFYKFDKRTGKLIWKYPAGSDSGVAIGFDNKIILPGAGMRSIDEETGQLLWDPKLTGGTNATPAYKDGQVFVPIRPSGGLLHELEDNKILALDAKTGKINWTFDETGGHTAPVVGINGYVYCGSGTNPYFFAFNEKGNGDGTTDCLFRVKMANKLIESTAALYRGRAYILSSGGYLYAIE